MELTCIKKPWSETPKQMAILKAAHSYFLIQLMYMYRATSDVIDISVTKVNGLLFNFIFCNITKVFQCIGTSNDEQGMLYVLKMLVKQSLSVIYQWKLVSIQGFLVEIVYGCMW